jgi:hypothetical protein
VRERGGRGWVGRGRSRDRRAQQRLLSFFRRKKHKTREPLSSLVPLSFVHSPATVRHALPGRPQVRAAWRAREEEETRLKEGRPAAFAALRLQARRAKLPSARPAPHPPARWHAPAALKTPLSACGHAIARNGMSALRPARRAMACRKKATTAGAAAALSAGTRFLIRMSPRPHPPSHTHTSPLHQLTLTRICPHRTRPVRRGCAPPSESKLFNTKHKMGAARGSKAAANVHAVPAPSPDTVLPILTSTAVSAAEAAAGGEVPEIKCVWLGNGRERGRRGGCR